MYADSGSLEKAVVFLHIPKTAGTTLHSVIERQYRPEELYSPGLTEGHSVPRLAELSEERRAKIRMFRGHMGFGVHRHLPRPSTYITILREPIERVISYYYFIRRTPTHYLHDLVRPGERDLEAFVASRAHVMIDNAQTRILSGVWHRPGFGECTPAMLEAAKTNLSHSFSVVGLAERFDESLLLMQRAFGWRNVFYARKNVSSTRPGANELTKGARQAIWNANELDCELYRYGAELFERQISRCGPGFAVQLRAFRLINTLMAPLIRAYWQARKVSVRAFIRRWMDRRTSSTRS